MNEKKILLITTSQDYIFVPLAVDDKLDVIKRADGRVLSNQNIGSVARIKGLYTKDKMGISTVTLKMKYRKHRGPGPRPF